LTAGVAAHSVVALAAALLLMPGQPARHAGAAPLSRDAARALQIQVRLDRSHYSPGEIDAAMGTNTRRALDAYTRAGGNPDAIEADAITTYRITDTDAAGPFTADIPDDITEQAALPALDYRDIVEMLGERFHASPALLRTLNPGKEFTAGDEIAVPNVVQTIEPVAGRGTPAAATVTVRRSDSSLTLTDGAGHVLLFAPVTTGSEHDPLPIGTWTVEGIQRNPTFHYNPDLFWDADPGHSKTVIAPGPNNPVGVVWIDINKPHYGLHGTPEPSEVGKVQSHGCVRMTNWDALRVAALVQRGT
jgi:lipoprotein-anchoring transpeptidase ErfK/SrfK